MTYARPHNLGRPGFSFPEVLFAVIILGVGLIMVASMFPIGIRLSQQAVSNLVAENVLQSASSQLQDLVISDGQPAGSRGNVSVPPDAVPPVLQNLWKPITTTPANNSLQNIVRGSQISSSDPRFAWIPLMYRRMNGSNVVEILVLVTQSTGRDTYDTSNTQVDVTNAASPSRPVCNLQPRRLGATIPASGFGGSTIPDTVVLSEISTGPDAMAGALGAATEGAFITVYKDNITTPIGYVGRMNGKYYRLGSRRTDLDTYNSGNAVYDISIVGPQFTTDVGADGILGNADDINAVGRNGISPSTVSTGGKPAYVYIVGRSFSDPSVTPVLATEYDAGSSQDQLLKPVKFTIVP